MVSKPDTQRSRATIARPSRRTKAFAAIVIGLFLGQPVWGAERFECLVEPYVEVDLSSAVAGVLGEVLVERGDVVKKGDVLVRLKSDVERAHLDLVRARAEFAERSSQRNEELYLRQMISSHDKDELETNAQLLKLETVEVETQLEQRTIRSPIDGVVVERMNEPGEFVNEKPVLRLAQIDPLRVEVAVPSRLFGAIKVGMSGRVQWEVPSSAVRTAKVTVVDRVVDAASGTMGVRLELANPDFKLPAGVKCWVSFAGG